MECLLSIISPLPSDTGSVIYKNDGPQTCVITAWFSCNFLFAGNRNWFCFKYLHNRDSLVSGRWWLSRSLAEILLMKLGLHITIASRSTFERTQLKHRLLRKACHLHSFMVKQFPELYQGSFGEQSARWCTPWARMVPDFSLSIECLGQCISQSRSSINVCRANHHGLAIVTEDPRDMTVIAEWSVTTLMDARGMCSVCVSANPYLTASTDAQASGMVAIVHGGCPF